MEMPSNPPLQKVKIGARGLVVYPLPSTDWRSLILLPAASDLRFAVTFDQAQRLWGPPDERGKNFSEYYRPEMRLVVSWVQDRSGDDTFESWHLYAYPTAASLTETFHTAIVGAVADSQVPIREVTIMDSTHKWPALRASIKNGNVYSLTWYPPPPPAKLPRPTE